MSTELRSGHKVTVLAIVMLHVVLVLGYTLPDQLVPIRARAFSITYARPLFHQDWRLFAPDPPLCSTELVVIVGDGSRHPLTTSGNYLEARIARTLAFHVRSALAAGDTTLHPDMERSVLGLWSARNSALPPFRLELVEDCVLDPERPDLRERHVTQLSMGSR